MSGDWELQSVRAGVPAGLGRCWAGRLGAGFGLYMTLTAKRQASGRKSSSFRPFSLRALLSLSSDVLAFLLALSVRSGRASWRHRGGGRRFHLAGVLGVSCVSCGRRQGWPLSCRVCWPSPLLAVLGQSVRALGLVLGMGGDLRPSGLLIGKMHKDSI